MSHGIDMPYLYRQAASYVDRILRGVKPGNFFEQAGRPAAIRGVERRDQTADKASNEPNEVAAQASRAA